MCGIVGLVNAQRVEGQHRQRDLVNLMATALRHRGPDDNGTWSASDGQTCFSHRRLSIVDLSSAGRNPMHSADGRFTISFNGEIYNFRELRQQLKTHGYSFRSNTDTEVVLAAFDLWGIDCLERFIGMFAFGLWDALSRRLYVVRDRLGKKPLYYAQYCGRFVFASELKAFCVDCDFPRDIDQDALSLYLRYGYVPSPYSIFLAARKLPPAHYAIIENGNVSIVRYWDPIETALGPQLQLSDNEAKEQFEFLLRDSTRLRLVSDVPLGVFLSGGIDSSLIAAFVQKESRKSVSTFSVRFDNPQYDEADHAAAVAHYLETDHHEQTCGMSQLLDLVDELPGILDEPFADSSILPTYLISKVTRDNVTVALAGDGGDELFFGYPRYRAFARHRRLLHSPAVLRRSAAGVLNAMPQRRLQRAATILKQDSGDLYSRFISWWSADEVEQLMTRPLVENASYSDSRLRLAALPAEERPPVLDLVSYLPEDILTKVDRASMAASLEARAPLLDHRIVELSLRLPLAMKFRGGTTKWLLRQVLYDHVPRHLVDRPKMGFGVPLGDWLRGPLRDRMDHLIGSHLLEELGINSNPIRRLWNDILAGRSHRSDVLWSTFALGLWAERWKRLS